MLTASLYSCSRKPADDSEDHSVIEEAKGSHELWGLPDASVVEPSRTTGRAVRSALV